MSGSTSDPQVHSHLTIAAAERDAWLLCMHRAVADQAWPADMKAQLMRAITVPAERVRATSAAR
jgi:hemoglobin